MQTAKGELIMKKKLTAVLTAIIAVGGAGSVFASDVLSQKYAELEKTDLDGKENHYIIEEGDYVHAEPAAFEFKSGVLSGKTGDFDGDGAEELLTVYAENTDKQDTFYVQMYEEQDGKAVLAAESDRITNFMTGEKGGACVFVKEIDGKNRIFMQYTGEINSYADGADVQIKGFDYDGRDFKTVLDVETGGSAADLGEKEAKQFKTAGLEDTFAFFVPDEEDGEMRYHFSPYYSGLNIGKLEKDKAVVADITVSTNIFDIYEKIDWDKTEERNEAAKKDGKITVKVNISSDASAETVKETEPKAPVTKNPNEIVVFLNGERMSFDSDPYIEKGTTRVPMRAIFEGLGAKVDWDNDKRLVTAEKDGIEIKLTIGEETALVNGEENKLLVPAEIKNSRTMVPLRFVSEALGAKVDWDGETKTITITDETKVQSDAQENIAGVYEKTFKEEIGGEVVENTYFVQLNDDNTGVISFQDVAKITWGNGEIKTDYDTVYKYTVKDGKLTLEMDGITDEFFLKTQDKKDVSSVK